MKKSIFYKIIWFLNETLEIQYSLEMVWDTKIKNMFSACKTSCISLILIKIEIKQILCINPDDSKN